MGFEQLAQGLDVLTVDMLHRETQAAGLHVLQVGVQFQVVAVPDLDDQGEGLVVLGVPLIGLVGGGAAQ